MSGLNRVAFNNFIDKAVCNKKSEFSEKDAGNIGLNEEMILKEILYRNNNSSLVYKKDYKSNEIKKTSKFVTLDDIEKIFR